jgi:DNA-binding response OmpR family regulator
LTRFLNLKGFETRTASSVAEAVPVLEGGGIDAVVLDVRMPEASGLDLLVSMRDDDRWREMPAVLLTGATLTQDELGVVARAKAHVFLKPKSYEALTNYLVRATGARKR